MKNAIGAVICLFVVFLHLLVVPPRNLRGSYYKNFEAANEYRTCNYEWTCNVPEDAENEVRRADFCGVKPNETENETDGHSCFGGCLTYVTQDSEDRTELFRGRRCIEYCEEYCLNIEDGAVSCFSCCYGDRCN